MNVYDVEKKIGTNFHVYADVRQNPISLIATYYLLIMMGNAFIFYFCMKTERKNSVS